MTTTTNTGTCAVCGRTIKLDRHGNIVRHGHTGGKGIGGGACAGAYYEPAETGTTALTALIHRCEAQMAYHGPNAHALRRKIAWAEERRAAIQRDLAAAAMAPAE